MDAVAHEPGSSRFARGAAYLAYLRTGDTLTIEHTVVPAESEGLGVGSALVRAAVDFARTESLQVVATCSFARSWLERHPGS